MKFSRASWKTASAGALAIGTALIAYVSVWINKGEFPGEALTLVAFTGILNGVGLLLARDNDKTSAEVGADVWQKERDKVDTKDFIETLQEK